MNEWISVKDKLPDKGVNVLLLIDGEIIEGCITNKDNEIEYSVCAFSWHGCGCCAYDYDGENVTHWMIKPELPQELT